MKRYINFEDIVELNIISKFCRLFYNITGLILDINDVEGLHPIRFYKESEENKFCRIIKNTKMGLYECIKTGRDKGKKASEIGGSLIYQCHAGLVDISVPILIRGNYIATLTTGQVLTSRPSIKKFNAIKQRVKKYEINLKELKSAYFNTPIIGKSIITSYIELINLVISYVFEVEDKIVFLKNNFEKSIVDKAKTYVENNYKNKIYIKDIAEFSCLSPSHFEHLFKKKAGMTFVEYLNLFRMSKAKKMLIDKSISKVYYEVGFNSFSHFYKIFKRYVGCSPKEYKKSIKAI